VKVKKGSEKKDSIIHFLQVATVSENGANVLQFARVNWITLGIKRQHFRVTKSYFLSSFSSS